MELKPLSRAPSLFSFNSIGFGVYGARDRDDDGAYSLTRYLIVLFIPVLPLDAFRVYDADEGGWHFIGKTALPGWQRLWQRGFLAAIALGVISLGVNGYLNNPDRLLDKEVAAVDARADAVQTKAERASVIDEYETLLRESSEASGDDGVGVVSRQALGSSYLRALIAQVPRPLGVDQIDIALQIVARLQVQPEIIRRGKVSNRLHEEVGAWLGDLEASDESGIYAALQLADEARSALIDSTSDTWQQEDTLRLRLAAQLAEEWPQDALRQYVLLAGRGDAGPLSVALIEKLELAPSVWLDLEPTLLAWRDAKVAGIAATSVRTKIEERLSQAAKSVSPDADKLLEAPDAQVLQKELKKYPGDQRMAIALAELQVGSGDAAEALKTLSELGAVGALSREGQRVVADVYSDLGRLEEADAVLQRILSVHMSAYSRVRGRYFAAYERYESELYARANSGGLPALLQKELNAMSQDEAETRFRAWVDQKLEDDNNLTALRIEMRRQSHVVPVSLRLGMVKLNRASAAEGPERKRLLASAERAFLAIQSEADGAPSYHLGLGQVYYRLGKSEKGDKEFDAVVALDDHNWTLAAARTYRNLGARAKATSLATKVYETAPLPGKHEAAIVLALSANTPEKREMWLRKSDPELQYVRMSLLEIEADRLRDEGKYKEADAKLKRIYEVRLKHASTSSTDANNAALAAASRYACTGNLERLKESVRLMEMAMELAPDSGIAVSNAGSIYSHIAQIDVLRRWVSTAELRLHSGAADSLIATLLHGAHEEQVRALLAEHPDMRRSVQRHRQAEVLAPQMRSVYYSQSHIARRLERTDSLEQLVKRLRQNELLGTEAEKTRYEEVLAGADDSQDRDDLTKTLARLLPLTEESPRRTPKTRAAAWILLSEAYLSLSSLEEGTGAAEKSANAARSALSLWPESGAESDLAAALFELGVLQAVERSSAFAAQWKAEKRRFRARIVVRHVLKEGVNEKIAALAAAPAFREYAELRAARIAVDPEGGGLGDFVVGQLLKNRVLLEAGERHFSLPRNRVYQEIVLRLAPYSTAQQEYADLMKARAN
jgi:cellulose synthase operon protein C